MRLDGEEISGDSKNEMRMLSMRFAQPEGTKIRIEVRRGDETVDVHLILRDLLK